MEKEILRKLEEWIGHEIRFRSWQKKYVPADQPAAIVVATVLMTLDDVIKHLKEIKGDVYYRLQSTEKSGVWTDYNILGLKLKVSF